MKSNRIRGSSDANPMIDHERRFCFVHIPKTGGTSVLTTLFPDLAGRWGSYRSHFLPREYPARAWRDYFSFCFIRNPWDRMVSLYHYWCDGAYLDLKHREISFAEFCRSYRKIITYKGKPNIHTRPQADFIARNSVPIKFWGRYENLQDDFDLVCKRLGLPATRLPWLIPSRDRASRSYREYYKSDCALIDFVAKEFAQDVQLGNYQF
jgi:hypothetical protein